jgi:MFS family permease
LLLVGARLIQGIGAAFMVPGSLAIIAKAYPKEIRGRAIGVWAAASSITSVAGPIVGGLVLTGLGDWSWRLVFAVNLPLGIVALALLWLRVTPDQAQKGRRLDMVGAALATLALLAIAYGLTGDSSESVPPVSHTLVWCGAGIALAVTFLFWESRAHSPMLPLRLFKDRGFSGANGLTFTLYFALGGTLFFLPMTMIGGWGETPATVSLVLMPMGLLLTVLSSASGRWSDRIGPAPLIAAGSVLVALAFLLLGLTAALHQPWTVVLPVIALMGLGMGLVVSPLSTAVMTSVDDGDTGIASGVNNAVARVAGLIAVALLGAIVTGVFETSLGEAAARPIFFGLPAVGLSSAEDAARIGATDAAFAAICYVTAGLALASAAIAWLTLERKL